MTICGGSLVLMGCGADSDGAYYIVIFGKLAVREKVDSARRRTTSSTPCLASKAGASDLGAVAPLRPRRARSYLTP